MTESKFIKVNQYYGSVPICCEFSCRHCGLNVQVVGLNVQVVDEKDKRTVYCSQKCEKQYWRDITKRNYGRDKNERN